MIFHDMSIDIEEQYDKIYRYCYFKLHNRELAEDITQEAFLRYFEKYHLAAAEQALKCLYTIARNLCIDEYRKQPTVPLEENMPNGSQEERLLTGVSVKIALAQLESDERELLLLRYVNEVPVSAIGQMFGLSRFAVYRKLAMVTKKFKHQLEEGNF